VSSSLVQANAHAPARQINESKEDVFTWNLR